MAPSKKRVVPGGKPVARRRVSPRACPCLQRPHSDGVCALSVWQGTTIEPDNGRDTATTATTKLLHRHMRVVKYKDLTLESLSGYMYLMVMLRWPPLLALFVALYVAVVGVFALLFALCDVDLTVRDATARDYFNLSVQTMATIGYGVLFPKDSCSNWVAVIESFVSMIAISLMTGIAFVKFARPRSHMIFSDTFAVASRDGGGPDAGLEMRFRVVNGTRRELIMKGEILEVSFKLILMRIEETKTGEKKLCYYDLHLKTTSYITLRLEAEIIHEIEEDSPFFGMTQDDFAKSDFLIILMMSGVDETLHDMVHKQFEYTYENLRWGAKFVPILSWDRLANYIELDFQHISATVPAPIDRVSEPDNVQIVVEGATNDTALSTETEGNRDMTDELENVADSDHEDERKLLRRTTLLWSPLTNDGNGVGIDYSDLESMRSFQEDNEPGANVPDSSPRDDDHNESTSAGDDDDDDHKSVVSTSTNSGSENEERHEATLIHHVRFDRRSRTTSLRLPRVSRRRRGQSNPLEPVGSSRRHTHEAHQDLHEQPMSLLRRRVRFKNHPLSRLSKGLYYRALETSWFRLFVYLALIYFSAIAVIALCIHVSARHAVVNTAGVDVDHHYERIFFFCAQTISTIGYGSLAPNPDSDLVNFYVSVLAIAGTVVSTLVTGLAWAKFSIPKASTITFSDYVLLTAFHSHRAIMFRAANSRTYGAIIEGSFRVSVVILNQRLGHKETHELKLVRNVWPVVQLASTVTHIIDDDSPLYDIPTDELHSGRHFFVVLFSGLDPVVGENMFSRKTYHSCDILVGHHFVDNIKLTSEGVHVDLEAINDTTLTPEIDLRESRLYPVGMDEPPPLDPSQEREPTSRLNEAFFVEPHESQRRRRRQADEEESIDITPRAAQYALM